MNAVYYYFLQEVVSLYDGGHEQDAFELMDNDAALSNRMAIEQLTHKEMIENIRNGVFAGILPCVC